MNKTLSQGHVLCSLVQYRRELTGLSVPPINLGVVIEGTMQNTWFVSLAMRQAVEATALVDLDRLSREVIDNRFDVMKGEVEAVLQDARQPGDVLRLLSARNPWSLHVVTPDEITAPAIAKDAVADDRVVQQYVIIGYQRAIEPVRVIDVAATARRQVRRQNAALVSASQIPPAWMLPPFTWRVPFVH